MPNWCANTVTFKHKDPERIKDIVAAWNSGNLMSTFFPCPEPLRNTTHGLENDPSTKKTAELRRQANIADYGYEDWYMWSIGEWGTKWDVGKERGARSLSVKKGAQQVKLKFDSAWSPPLDFYEKMTVEKGYEINAYYFEPGMGFCGTWRKGKTTEFSLAEADTLDDLRAAIPAAIIDEFKLQQLIE